MNRNIYHCILLLLFLLICLPTNNKPRFIILSLTLVVLFLFIFLLSSFFVTIFIHYSNSYYVLSWYYISHLYLSPLVNLSNIILRYIISITLPSLQILFFYPHTDIYSFTRLCLYIIANTYSQHHHNKRSTHIPSMTLLQRHLYHYHHSSSHQRHIINITSTSRQHHINITSTSHHQHHINVTSTSHQHHVNITSTSHQQQRCEWRRRRLAAVLDVFWVCWSHIRSSFFYSSAIMNIHHLLSLFFPCECTLSHFLTLSWTQLMHSLI